MSNTDKQRAESMQLVWNRLDAALDSNELNDLRLAQQSLIGSLDWAARDDDEMAVKQSLRLVQSRIDAARAE